MSETTPALIVRDLSKTFGATRALRRVSLTFPNGTITALLGENGSGKSALIKSLAGVYTPDPGRGEIEVGSFGSLPRHTPDVAWERGLRFLHQDLGLVQEARVVDNIAFTAGYLSGQLSLVRRRKERARAQELLDRFSVGASPDAYLADLSPSDQTMIAVARLFGEDDPGNKVFFLDEPSATLPGDQVELVFGAMRRACDEGASVVLVSHRLEEVLEIADRVVVLRDGQVVAEQPIEGLGVADLVELMIGRPLEQREFTSTGVRSRDDALLRVEGLAGGRLNGVDIELERGTILGVTGLVGCGRSALIRLLAGSQVPRAGKIFIDGKEYAFRSPRDAISAGLASVPQDRRRQGVVLDFTIRENLTLGNLRDVRGRFALSPALERKAALEFIHRLDIRPPDPEKLVRTLSGGNQQKVAVGRVLRLAPKVLLLDEPTQGIDIGARDEIGQVLRKLTAEGISVILASSDGDELLDLADRIVVLDRGHVRTVLERDEITRENLALAINRTTEGSVPA
jgi:ribose transport system ATP-binding protein